MKAPEAAHNKQKPYMMLTLQEKGAAYYTRYTYAHHVSHAETWKVVEMESVGEMIELQYLCFTVSLLLSSPPILFTGQGMK